MKRFDLNTDFSADCTIAEKSRSGTIYRVQTRNTAGGKMLTPVALYFAWQPDFDEGYNRYWRVDCFVNRHPLAPSEPMILGRELTAALRHEGLCDEPIWLSTHRSDDEKGEAIGNVFEDEPMDDGDAEIVASGTWLYDQNVPRQITIMRTPAERSGSRYDWETNCWDESRPIPETTDGFVYSCSLGKSGEHLSIADAKAWADAQPWGPVKWD